MSDSASFGAAVVTLFVVELGQNMHMLLALYESWTVPRVLAMTGRLVELVRAILVVSRPGVMASAAFLDEADASSSGQIILQVHD